MSRIHAAPRLIVPALAAFAAPLVAADPPTTPAPQPAVTVEQRLAELEQQIRILERKDELAQEAAKAKAKDATTVKAGADGFSFGTADGSFKLRIGGYVQADGRFYQEEEGRNNYVDQFQVRRVRPIIEAALGPVAAVRIMPDFGAGTAQIIDAYGDVYLGPVTFRAGKFTVPFGLVRLQSNASTIFLEPSLVDDLTPNRDVGASVTYDYDKGLVSVTGGVFDGALDGGSRDGDVSDHKEFVGRVWTQPLKNAESPWIDGLGLGVAATWEDDTGTPAAPNLASYKSPGQQNATGQFFRYRAGAAPTVANTVVADDEHWRFGPQLFWSLPHNALFAEYVRSSQEVQLNHVHAQVDNVAWAVQGSWVLTGERPTYKGVVPKRPFGADGWGAFELVLRYHTLDVDDDAFPVYADPNQSATEARTIGGGVNWWATRNLRASVNYEQTTFAGGAAGGTDIPTEKYLVGRVQLAF